MIYGQRIRLRAVERDDLPRFVQWFNDPEVRQGLTRFLPLGIAEEERWFDGLLDLEPVERPFAVDVRAGDDWVHVGSCGLFRFDLWARHAELGIAIGDKAYWDQGYGSDATRTLLRHAFETLNLNRVFLRVFETNPRALTVYSRAGLKQEGRLRQDRFLNGRYVDTLIMGILRTEWELLQEK